MKKRKNETAIYCLGGLGEIGKNSYCIEHEDSIVLVDAGVKFAGNTLPGIDYVIPDYTYLKENNEKFKALFITHGHEDHIGGIVFLAQTVQNMPIIYAPKLAASLIRKKLVEHKLTNLKIIEFDHDSTFKIGKINISFFRQNHSIPDAFGILFKTSNGNIVTTGDFTIDLTPTGDRAEIQKMAAIGAAGVDLLLSDSTNAEVADFTMSEMKVSVAIN
ncbi:MAG: MBL fold metallo-hydrolase, partial [Bacilli bacterium]